jgi:hypothetical protein
LFDRKKTCKSFNMQVFYFYRLVEDGLNEILLSLNRTCFRHIAWHKHFAAIAWFGSWFSKRWLGKARLCECWFTVCKITARSGVTARGEIFTWGEVAARREIVALTARSEVFTRCKVTTWGKFLAWGKVTARCEIAARR